MSAQQKIAWFNLSIALVSVVSYLALWPAIGPWRAMGAFGLLGFSGLSVLFYYRSKSSGRIVADERDQLIATKSVATAKSVIWIAMIAAFLVALLTIGENGNVSMQMIALVLWIAFCVFLMVQSITALILYARS